MMRKFKSKKWNYIICLFIFSLFFYFLNDIIAFMLPQELQLHKGSFDEYEPKSPVYVYMNNFEYDESNIKEVVNCSGWAFAETKEETLDKMIKVVLKGEKATYISENCNLKYDDVHVRFPTWKDMPGENNNFNIQFSTINLPNDIYEIYIYVFENDNVEGIASTGQAFKKRGIHVYNYPVGQLSENINIDEAESATYGWLSISDDTDFIQVSGWIATDMVQSDLANYYIVFEGNNGNIITLKVPNYCRTDVAEYLQNSMYMSSGILGGMLKDELPDSKGNIYVVMEYGKKYYKSTAKEYDCGDE